MKTEFTPGVWGVEEFGGSIYVGRLRQGEGRSGFEDVLYATDCRGYTESALERERANARLIAAAPKLYEIGDRLVAYLADLNGSKWIPGADAGSIDMRQRAKALQSLLYAALAEVRGK